MQVLQVDVVVFVGQCVQVFFCFVEVVVCEVVVVLVFVQGGGEQDQCLYEGLFFVVGYLLDVFLGFVGFLLVFGVEKVGVVL